MVIGDASSWVAALREVNEEIIAVIVRVWPNVSARFKSDAAEDEITDYLVVAMRRDKDIRDRWLVDREHELLPQGAGGQISERPSIDIVVRFTLRQSVYLAYECKRLRVMFPSGFKPLADKYVDEGMMRFLLGKYSPGLYFAAMLGYVMDSDIEAAVENIRDVIVKREAKLCCDRTINALPAFGLMTRMSTVHNIPLLGSPFTFHHGLLPLSCTPVRTAKD